MESDQALQKAKSRTYELVGRNLIRLQQLEQLFKAILPSASMAGTDVAELKAKRDENSEKIETQTLGNLVNRFTEEVLLSEDTHSFETIEEPGVYFSLRCFHQTESSMDEQIARLNELVESRNHLVHHLLNEITQDDPSSWFATHPFLEELGEKVRKEIETLHQLISSPGAMAQLLENPEVRDLLKNGD